jgi:hypothetical protein
MYLIYYHKIDLSNILDLTHTTFIRQIIFELIPFVVLFGIKEMQFINISSASNFFSSIIGRSIMSTVGFTIVTIVLTKINNQSKINNLFGSANISNKKEEPEKDTIKEDENNDQDNEEKLDNNETVPVQYAGVYMGNSTNLNNLLLQSNNNQSYTLI